MDFTGRSAQPSAPASAGPQVGGNAGGAANNKKNKDNRRGKLAKVGTGVLGLLVLPLVVGVIVSVATRKSEASYVDDSKMQAVFLQTGQVYFGDIKSINDKNFVLSNIYYLQTSSATGNNQQQQNTNVSLVKLGCELHAPFDQMVINRDQITFWENLQDDGQVAKAVATFQKDNPNGQKCADQSAAPSGSTNSNATQNSQSTTNTTTTNNSGTSTTGR